MGFFHMGVALFTKKATLNSFERVTQEIDAIWRAKINQTSTCMMKF